MSAPQVQLLPQLQFSHVQFGLSHFVDPAVSLLVMHMRLRPTPADQAATELIRPCRRPINGATDIQTARTIRKVFQ
ncbi:hypothetical protein A5731_06360 [Mycolicibacterium conceptionense]|uniref:Uncharacterized protein n=2 Tax=Mycolicibacterium TaxID=1866885 RepID=A0ABR5FPR4_9MYCO|nr:hypothetical protein ABW05_29280 [Mycolicibacterium senegalense]KMV20130.1 hypothetical protein ACT17_00015 [Mycolicibacterium conceptionense]OBB04260.1 hypothetical protein A5718_25470 [Mycolicibacterium conceptionense]OBF07910.1 hypothetical protein A5731_06360 [Mycolicibacterium conceptionense]OBF47444.1 hypothetical protein A5720_06270 [Mycolicibacterium conceptionense]